MRQPAAPRTRRPPTGACRVSADAAFVRTTPAHAVSAPRESVPGVAPSKTATSDAPGATPPCQAAGLARSVSPAAPS